MFKLLILNFSVIVFPNFMKRVLLNMLGHEIEKGARVGIVLIGERCQLKMSKGALLGSFNILACNMVVLGENAKIGKFNYFKGLFDVNMDTSTAIGNFNQFTNGGALIVKGKTKISLARFSNITSSHYFDLTSEIEIGTNSVVGGKATQFWTHGFQHFQKGEIRYRVDGGISLGDGVYLGARVTINPGVKIEDSVSVGAGAVVAKNLSQECMYVSQPLREIDVSKELFFKKYELVELPNKSILSCKRRF